MMFSYITLLCVIQSLFAVELSIYKSFTEIRQVCNGVGEYQYQFTNGDFSNLIDGSINWEGTPLARQEVYNAIETLQNAKVTVRRSTVCSCETIEAEIVDPSSMLLKNLNTGAYFYADKESIEYTSTRPTQGGATLSLQFQSQTTQRTGTLSYLMKGITWTPTYDLLLTGNTDYKLRAYANIKNDQEREYTIEMTRLLGGNVQLANGIADSHREPELDAMHFSMKPIQLIGEQSGLYSYALNDKYTLRPASSIRLPFIDIHPTVQFYYKAMTSIRSGIYRGIFDKTYDITPDHFMPAGVITVRDNQVLVGQANLPDVPENYTQTFSLGQDNDIRYLIKSNMTSKTDDKAPIQLETYEVEVEVMNFKNKVVKMQLAFQGGVQMTLVDSTCTSADVQGNQLTMPFQLEQSQHRQCKFHVTMRLN